MLEEHLSGIPTDQMDKLLDLLSDHQGHQASTLNQPAPKPVSAPSDSPPQRPPSQQWEDVSGMTPAGRDVLRAAGITPAVAVRLIADLGFTEPDDLEVTSSARDLFEARDYFENLEHYLGRTFFPPCIFIIWCFNSISFMIHVKFLFFIFNRYTFPYLLYHACQSQGIEEGMLSALVDVPVLQVTKLKKLVARWSVSACPPGTEVG